MSHQQLGIQLQNFWQLPFTADHNRKSAAKRLGVSCQHHDWTSALPPWYCPNSLWYCHMSASRVTPSFYVTAVAPTLQNKSTSTTNNSRSHRSAFKSTWLWKSSCHIISLQREGLGTQTCTMPFNLMLLIPTIFEFDDNRQSHFWCSCFIVWGATSFLIIFQIGFSIVWVKETVGHRWQHNTQQRSEQHQIPHEERRLLLLSRPSGWHRQSPAAEAAHTLSRSYYFYIHAPTRSRMQSL